MPGLLGAFGEGEGDASTLSQPGGTGDDWRLHLAYDLLAGRMHQVGVMDRRGGEHLARYQWHAGEVIVADPGYGYRRSVATAVWQQADIVVRIHPATLWPPNGKLVPVTVSGTITDADSGVDANRVTYAVKDEYRLVQPRGPITLGGNGSYSFRILLQASRKGNDKDGRQYIVTISALDNAGNQGSDATGVTVPHDQGHRCKPRHQFVYTYAGSRRLCRSDRKPAISMHRFTRMQSAFCLCTAYLLVEWRCLRHSRLRSAYM